MVRKRAHGVTVVLVAGALALVAGCTGSSTGSPTAVPPTPGVP